MKRSTAFGSKNQARSVARNVRGASISKYPKPHRRSGCALLIVAALTTSSSTLTAGAYVIVKVFGGDA
jgi:hypothetical protein